MEHTIPEDMSKSQPGHQLQQLPNELLIHLLSYVDAGDLLTLRATSHSLHRLIHTNETALCMAFDLKLQALYDSEGLSLWHVGDLPTLFVLGRELQMLKTISTWVSGRIVSKIHFRHESLEAEVEAFKVRKRHFLQGKLLRAIFMLEQFLQRFRACVVRGTQQLESFSDAEYVDLGRTQVFGADQQTIIEELFAGKESLVLQVSAALLVIRGVFQAHGLATPDPAERSESPWLHVMVHHGLAPLADLLAQVHPPEHWNKVLADRSREIWHQTRYPPPGDGVQAHVTTIYPFRQPQANSIDEGKPICRSRTAQIALLNRQNCWDEAAQAVLLRAHAGRTKRDDSAVQLNDYWLKDFLAEDGDPDFDIGPWDHPDLLA